MMAMIITCAHVPAELLQAWLQHLRDFDTAHPGCHFEVVTEELKMSVPEMIEAMRVNPKLTLVDVFKRGLG